jgi:hypothetical protein
VGGKKFTSGKPAKGSNRSLARSQKPIFETNPEIVDKLRSYISEGLTHESAARLAGIAESTLSGWLKKATAGDPKYLCVLEAIKNGESEFERKNVTIIQRAAAKSWTAAAWLLERRYPNRWARRDQSAGEHTETPPTIVVVFGRNKQKTNGETSE